MSAVSGFTSRKLEKVLSYVTRLCNFSELIIKGSTQ